MRLQPPFTCVLLVAMLSGLMACRSIHPSSDVATAFRERLTPKAKAELQRDWHLARVGPATWTPSGVTAPAKDYPCAENGWRAPIYAKTSDRLYRFYVPYDDKEISRWTSAQRIIVDYQRPSSGEVVAQTAGRTVRLLLEAAYLAVASAGQF